MNKIEKLLNELCPNGVEFVTIGSIIKRIRDKVKKQDVKVYSVSNTLGLIKSAQMRDRQIHSKEIANYTIVRRGQFAYNPARLNIGSFAYLKDEIGAVSPMYVVFSIDETKILQQFLFYYVKSPRILQKIISLTEEGARFRFDFERWEKIQIPIPPLEIQEEIVKILDTFTELEAELEARVRQYEHYRNKLLSLEYLESNGGYELKMLGEICEYVRGVTYAKNQEMQDLDNGVKILRANNITLNNTLDLSDLKAIYKNTKIKDTQFLKKQDILICAGSGSKEHIGKIAFIDKDMDFAFGGFMGVIRSKEINSHFLFFYLASEYFRFFLKKELESSTINNLNSALINRFQIPIPSLETQEKIVSILDQFHALTTDLQSGIPAEIEARKKQYEYYRNKLLTFKEAR